MVKLSHCNTRPTLNYIRIYVSEYCGNLDFYFTTIYDFNFLLIQKRYQG